MSHDVRIGWALNPRCLHRTACSILDALRKGTFYEDETPLNEPAKFRARTAVQQKQLSQGVRQKLLKESRAADPETANRGVL